jgi:hypothetical protein
MRLATHVRAIIAEIPTKPIPLHKARDIAMLRHPIAFARLRPTTAVEERSPRSPRSQAQCEATNVIRRRADELGISLFKKDDVLFVARIAASPSFRTLRKEVLAADAPRKLGRAERRLAVRLRHAKEEGAVVHAPDTARGAEAEAVMKDALVERHGHCQLNGAKAGEYVRIARSVPWSACKDSDPSLMLDPFASLLLSLAAACAYEKGDISFSNSGRAILSPMLSRKERAALAFHGIIQGAKLSGVEPEHAPHLRFHRENVLRKSA